jgi:hypothetical protein
VRVAGRFPLVYGAAPCTRFLVDGRPYPAVSDTDVILPIGSHVVRCDGRGSEAGEARLVGFNGRLLDARYGAEGAIEITYESAARAYARFDRVPTTLLVDDGALAGVAAGVVVLPRGQHRARVAFAR